MIERMVKCLLATSMIASSSSITSAGTITITRCTMKEPTHEGHTTLPAGAFQQISIEDLIDGIKIPVLTLPPTTTPNNHQTSRRGPSSEAPPTQVPTMTRQISIEDLIDGIKIPVITTNHGYTTTQL